MYADIDTTPQFEPSQTTVADILTKDALEFIVLLHRTFNARRKQLLANRGTLQSKLDSGEYQFDFLMEDQ